MKDLFKNSALEYFSSLGKKRKQHVRETNRDYMKQVGEQKGNKQTGEGNREQEHSHVGLHQCERRVLF